MMEDLILMNGFWILSGWFSEQSTIMHKFGIEMKCTYMPIIHSNKINKNNDNSLVPNRFKCFLD